MNHRPVVLAKRTSYDRDLHIGRVSSSTLAAWAGLNPWVSPLMAWLQARGEVEPQPDNMDMRMGRMLEPIVAQLFSEETGMRVKNPNAVYCHPQNKSFIATPDRLVIGKRAVLECKTGGPRQARQWADGNVPPYYEIQARWQALVLGYEEAYIAALIGGKQFFCQLLEHDPEIASSLLRIAEDFLAAIESGTPPEPTYQDTDLVRSMHPQAEPISIVLPESLDYARLSVLRTRLKEQEQEVTQLENCIKSTMGDAELAYLPGDERPSFTWKNQSRMTLDTKRLKAELPEVYEQYARETTSRVFRVRGE